MTSLSRRLRDAREGRGLRLIDIADAFGISTKAVSQWERDETTVKRKPARPDIDKLPKLARILGVSLTWLMTGEEDERPTHPPLPGQPRPVYFTPPQVVRMLTALASVPPGDHALKRMFDDSMFMGDGSRVAQSVEALRQVRVSPRAREALAEQLADEILGTSARTFDLAVIAPPFATGTRDKRASRDLGYVHSRDYPGYLRKLLTQLRAITKPKGSLVVIKDGRIIVEGRPDAPVARLVPYVGRLAAGPWLDVPPPYPLDLKDPQSQLSTKATSSKAFTLEIVDDLMSALYGVGDRVVVDPDKAPRPRSDVVVRLRDRSDGASSVALRRVARIDKNADNRPRAYVFEALPGNGPGNRIRVDARQVDILGTVVEHVRKAA
jgi:transcriptional regulator with XRE-family HTH domain/SOS-response transcriptional repressor LexA